MTADALFWDNLAEKYSKQPVADPGAFERKIAVTLGLIRPGDSVLDVGCGTGSLALRLAPSAKHVHGLDVSKEMIRIARGKAETAGTGNVTFDVGDFSDEFESRVPGPFDGVCAYNILHLVDDPPSALSRILRLLKPGGFFVASTPCLGDSLVPYRPLIAVMRAFGKAPSVSILTKAQLASQLTSAGFVELQQPDVGAKPIVGFMVARKAA